MLKVSMIRRSHEGGRHGERLSYGFKLPLAIALGASAVFGSQAQATTENIYELPRIHADNFDERHILKTSVTIDPSGYHYTSNELPAPFAMAFENGLHDPIVQIGINDHAMDAVDVHVTGGDDEGDNGAWASQIRRVMLLISSNDLPPEKRLYSDIRMINIALEHETFHALNEEWYRYARLSEIPLTGRYDSIIETAEAQYDASLEATLGGLNDLCGLDKDTSDHTYDLSCVSPTLLKHHVENAYSCIDEGHSLQKLLARTEELPIGHPYDNLTETGSSLLTSLNNNPSYVKECLADTSNSTNIPLRKLSATVLRLAFAAHPDLETYFRGDNQKSEIIDWILEAA